MMDCQLDPFPVCLRPNKGGAEKGGLHRPIFGLDDQGKVPPHHPGIVDDTELRIDRDDSDALSILKERLKDPPLHGGLGRLH